MNLPFAIFRAIACAIALFALPALGQEKPPPAGLEAAIFAGGCFWCMEPPFDALPGVVSTTSGYTAGRTKNPNYHDVSAGITGHTEAVRVVYDPKKSPTRSCSTFSGTTSTRP